MRDERSFALVYGSRAPVPRVLLALAHPQLRANAQLACHLLGVDGLALPVGSPVALASGGIDVAIVEEGGHGWDGVRTCLDIRAEGLTCVVMIVSLAPTALDAARAMEAGADDYIPGAVSARLLAARLRARLRRVSASLWWPVASTGVLAAGDLRLDAGNRTVANHGVEIPLTDAEFAILECLLRQDGNAVSVEALEHSLGVRAHHGSADVTVRSFVRDVRRKLRQAGCEYEPRAVAGVGYRLAAVPCEARIAATALQR